MKYPFLMTIYSHYRLSYFEQCPQKYKLNYIDKVETEIAESIEAFLGSRVHETLEKLYRDLQYQKMNSLEDLVGFFRDEWFKNWNDSIVIVKKEEAATPEEIMEHCRANLASFKRPRSVVFTDELPRNPMGKVLKRVLREQYGEG